jgi:protoporphyrinogen oxidase
VKEHSVNVAVIGAGIAGIAAGDGFRRAGSAATIYEAHPYWGGHTHSDVFGGCTFDEGPHVSFTPDERVQEVFLQGAGEVEELAPRITNWFRGKWVTHPAQVNLHGLDPELITQCIVDFVEAQANPPEIVTYADWLTAMYGKTFAETFPFAYTRKYWTVEPSDLGIDWVGSRMYPPKLEEVVRGAIAAENKGDFHYLKKMRYPKQGGYQSFLNAMAEGLDIRTSKQVIAIDMAKNELRFGDGTSASFDRLVSSMPLDQMIPLIEGVEVPDEVRAAATRLLCSSVVLVDIGVNRTNIFDHDWFYVYDEDISFSRVHLPHRLSPQNAPPGVEALQAEVYFSRKKPLETPVEQLEERAVNEFIQMGIIRNHEEVAFTRTRTLQYANIVFDHERRPALDVILPFVESLGIELIGRFGQWDYHWTDDSTKTGWQAASDVTGVALDHMFSGSES